MKLKDLAFVILLQVAASAFQNLLFAAGEEKNYKITEVANNDPNQSDIRSVISSLSSIPRCDRVTLAVICPITETEHLTRFLKSLTAQSILPHEIIIDISVNNGMDRELHLLLLDYSQVAGFHFFVHGGRNTFTEDLSVLRLVATSEIYSFFTCDALMHPQRIDILSTILYNDPHIGAVLHGNGLLMHEIAHSDHLEAAFPKLDTNMWNSLCPAQWVVDKCRLMIKHGQACIFDQVIKEVGVEPAFPVNYSWLTLRKSAVDAVIPHKSGVSQAFQYASKLLMYNIQVAIVNEALGYHLQA